MSDADRRSKEVEANYEAFVALLPTIIDRHKGQYVLMKNKRIVDYFSSAIEAWTAGELMVQDKLFSIQEVIDVPVDLGYFSHAVHNDSV
jgi:hypothetical protein